MGVPSNLVLIVYLMAICDIHSLAEGRKMWDKIANINSPTNNETSKIKYDLLRDIFPTHSDLKEALYNYVPIRKDGANTKSKQFSVSCYEDFSFFVQQLKNKSIWALEMFDSFGKPGTGLLQGRFYFIGDYAECRSILSHKGAQGFKGQYCNAQFKVNITKMNIVINGQHWGFCFPDTCQAFEVEELLNTLMSSMNITEILFHSPVCHKSHPLSTKAVAVICLSFFLIGIAVIGTTVDIFLIQRPVWESESQENRSTNGDLLDDSIVVDDMKDLISISAMTGSNQSIFVRCLTCFSLYSNGKKLLTTRQSKDSLKCLNGIRVISMSWVILGHSVVVMSMVTENMKSYSETHLKLFTFQAILNATLSVDTFFVLSGLLVAYLSLKELNRKLGKFNWLMFFLHRYIRLTPMYMVVLAIFATTKPYWFDGPFTSSLSDQFGDCHDSWWANLLYVQNLIRFDKSCMDWAWYLAVDMQFYVLSPLIFAPLFYKPMLGYFSSGIFFLASTITPWALTALRHYSPGVGKVKDQSNDDYYGNRGYFIYQAPYSRMGPYIVGLLLGYTLFRTRGKIRIPRSLNICAWLAAWAIAVSVLYGLVDYARGDLAPIELSAAYNALSRSAWGCSVAWVIFSCVNGSGGFVDTFLSWHFWVPLSRLTYAVYLVHPIYLGILAFSRETAFYLNDYSLIMVFTSALLVCYVGAIFVSLVCEAPVMALEKVLLKKEERNTR